MYLYYLKKKTLDPKKMELGVRLKIISDPSSTLQKGLEFQPSLKVYLSSDIDAGQIPQTIENLKQGSEYLLQLSSKECQKKVNLQHACICFQYKVDLDIKDEETGRSYGYVRKSPIAEAILFIDDLLETLKTSTVIEMSIRDKTPFYEREREVKLKFEIKCTLWQVDPSVEFFGSHDITLDILNDNKMTNLTFQFEDFYKDHFPTDNALALMHIPTWRGQFSAVPACMWIHHKPKTPSQMKSCRDISLRCIEIALSMCNWNMEEMIRSIKAQFASDVIQTSFIYVIRVLSTAVCMVSHACDYVSDLSAGKDTERFKEVISALCAGDCEDLSWEIFRNTTSIIESSQVIEMDDDWSWIRRVFLLYIPTMLTGSAFNPMMQNRNAGVPEGEKLICHVFSGMFPRSEFIKRLNVPTSVKNDIMSKMAKEMEMNAWEKDLPALIQEGTNMNLSLMLKQHQYTGNRKVSEHLQNIDDYRDFVESKYPAFKKLSVEMHQNLRVDVSLTVENFSDFYHCINNAWIDLKKYGYNMLDFSVGYGTNRSHIYGIRAFSWVNYKTDRFSFEPINCFSDNDWIVAQKILEKEPPIEIPSVFSKQTRTKNKIPRSLTELHTMYPIKETQMIRNDDALWYQDYVSYRVNHWSKISLEIEKSLRDCLQTGYFIGIQVIEHHISSDGLMYIGEIRLFPNNKMMQ